MRFPSFTPTKSTNKKAAAFLTAAMLTLGACGSDASDSGEPTATTEAPTPVETTVAPDPGPKGNADEQATDYIGLSEADALALAAENDVAIRVSNRDGESLAVTLDYSEDRVNLTVVDDEVTDATFG